MAEELKKTNSFKVVGTLIGVDTKKGQMKSNGQDFISVTATVKSVIDGKSNEFEIEFFASKLTKEGKPSQLYINYDKMGEMKDKKVEVTGEIRENRFWSTKTSQMASNLVLSGKFLKGVTSETADCGTFEMVGFIAKELTEKQNKDKQVYRYDLVLGIANYNNQSASLFTLNVDPDNIAVVKGTQSWKVTNTVKVNGQLRCEIEKVEKTEDSAFGEPIVKTFINKKKNFFITSGSNPFTEEGTFYTNDLITGLLEAYKAEDVKKQAEAAASNPQTEEAAESKAPVTSRQTSLI